jgi:hypothetical protein
MKVSFLIAFLTALLIPNMISAQGDDFYRCTRKDGTVVITNRHKSEDWVKCQPFELNRDFKTSEQRRRSEPVSAVSERNLEEAAEAARSSAEAARISADAARSAATAARAAATAADTALAYPPEQFCCNGYMGIPLQPLRPRKSDY